MRIMKKLYKPICFIAAVAAMSLTSCQKETYAPVSDEGTVITVHATVEDVANASKTHIDGTQVYWDQDEQMKVVSFDAAAPETSGKEANSSSFTPSADYTTATFTVTVNNEAANTIAGVYPASAAKGLGSDTKASSYKIELKANQSATASSYDPEAYVMITRPQTLPVENNEWNAYYIRIAALTRMEVSGLNDNIKSVTITFPDGQDAAGRRYFNLAESTAGEIYYGQTNEITVSYAEPLAAGTTQDVWFTSWNVDVAEGETVTVKVESDTKIYTKTFKATKAISLKENFLNIMPVDMSDATEGSAVEPSGQGTISDPYNVAAALKAIADEGTVKNVYVKGYITNIQEVSTQYGNATYDISDDVNGINSLNVYRGYYLNDEKFTSEDQIKTGDEVIVFGNLKNYNGTYEFDSGNYIYSLNGKLSTPLFEVTNNSQTVSAETASVSFNYVAQNLTGTVTATVADDADNIVSGVSVDTENSKVLVSLVPNTDETEKTASITLSANTAGVEDVTLTVIQQKFIPVTEGTVVLKFPDENSANNGVGSYSDTWTAMSGAYTFTIANFNNNRWNSDWTFIKCGSNKNLSIATICNETAMPKLSSIEVTVDKANDSQYINSVTLTIYSDAENTVQVGETIERTDYTAGIWEFAIPEDIQAEGLYYKLTCDCQQTKSNGIIQISKVQYVAAQ